MSLDTRYNNFLCTSLVDLKIPHKTHIGGHHIPKIRCHICDGVSNKKTDIVPSKSEAFATRGISWHDCTIALSLTRSTSSLFLHVLHILIREKGKTNFKSLNRKGSAVETGNILLPSTHQSDVNSSERQHPHVNTESSEQDPLQAQRAESMGKWLLWNCTSWSKGHLL